MGHWVWEHLGIRGTGPWYSFWSGFGSDLTEFAIIAGAWHAVNCHEDGCWRVGFRETVEANGHRFRRCRKHHGVRHEES